MSHAFVGCAVLCMSAASMVAIANGGMAPAGKEWPTVGGDLSNARYSALSQISTKNVVKLGGAWFKELDAATRTPPVVADGMLFISDATAIYALNLENGKTIWQYKPQRGVPARGGVALGRGLVFSGLSDAHIVALEERTGKLVWTGYIGNAPSDAGANGGQLHISGIPGFSPQVGSIANAPTYVNDMVISGLTGGDAGARGKISGLDAATGRLVWNFQVIPAAPDAGSQTWPPESDTFRTGGGAVWTQGAADPELSLVFYGTGNAVPISAGEVRRGDNLYTASVVALDVKSGKLKWHYQLTHHDLWEMDVSTPLILYAARVDGRPRKALAAMRTDGYLFLLDRQTGKPIQAVEERPVKQDLRLATAETQPFPVGADRFGLACADPETLGRGFSSGCYFDPIYDKPDIAVPMLNARQAPMSYDPRTGYFYVMGIVMSAGYRRFEDPYGLVEWFPPGTREYGIYAAIDAKTDRIVWQKRSPWGLGSGSGALTTAGGLLFHMEGDGNFEASNARTGKLLWRFQTGSLGDPGPAFSAGGVPIATYEFEGTQYVAVPMGKGLWAFKLGGSLPPQQPPAPPPNEYGFAGVVQQLPDDGSGEILMGGLVPGSYLSGYMPFKDEYALLPARARVKVGSRFKWTNLGRQRHTMVSADGSWTTGPVEPGQSAVVSIPESGTYEYFCKEHPWSRGQLLVSGAEVPGNSPARAGGGGAFTPEQASRGKTNFQRNCGMGCHMPDLTAGERAPALSGRTFLQHWAGLSADELFQRIRNTMPQQNPHSLGDQAYIDIVAFLLQANGLPAGTIELTANPEALGKVIVQPAIP